jgi:hypothetical protein
MVNPSPCSAPPPEVLDVVDGTSPKPILTPAGAQPTKDETEAHRKLIDGWETKAARACATLLPTISGRLMTYVEVEDDPARIWTILHDRFRPTTDVTLAQALKHIVTLRMADDGDMEAHVRDFTAGKRRIEEHGVALTDIVYRTFFLISMPTTYQMTVTAIESQSSVTLEVAQNRLLEEWRKRKGQPTGGLLMTAMYAKKKSQKSPQSRKFHRKPEFDKFKIDFTLHPLQHHQRSRRHLLNVTIATSGRLAAYPGYAWPRGAGFFEFICDGRGIRPNLSPSWLQPSFLVPFCS